MQAEKIIDAFDFMVRNGRDYWIEDIDDLEGHSPIDDIGEYIDAKYYNRRPVDHANIGSRKPPSE